jgi:hypothetical protein
VDNKSSQFAAHIDTCPKCGYKPASADDPLLTAHNGEGECPSCGIIPAKFGRGRTGEPERTGGIQLPEPKMVLQESQPLQQRQSSFPVAKFLVGLLLVAVIGYYGFRSHRTTSPDESPSIEEPSDSSDTSNTSDSSDRSLDRLSASDSVPASALTIAPGEEKTFTFSGYLPFFHRDEEDPIAFEPKWTLVINKWEELGVKVTLVDSKIATETAPIWIFRSEGKDTWQPVWANFNMSFNRQFKTYRHGGGLEQGFKFPNIVGCSDMWALRKLGGMPQSRAEEILKQMVGGSPELKRDNFHLYRVDLKFSIRTPEGDTFHSKSKWREEIFVFKLTGIMAENAAIDLSESAQFEMTHKENTEGIVLANPSNWILKQSE